MALAFHIDRSAACQAEGRLATVSYLPAFTRPQAIGLLRTLVVIGVGIMAFVALTELVSAVGGTLVDNPVAMAAPTPDVATTPRVVLAGETLWGIASEYDGDVRERTDTLVRLNGGSTVLAGNVIVVPESWVKR